MWRLRQGTPSADYSPLPVSRLTIPTLASHIDGAGLAKLETLGQAVTLVQRLKAQFEPIADMVTNLVVVSTRGGSDIAKVRGMRESIAQIKAQIESSEGRVRKMHTVDDSDAQSS